MHTMAKSNAKALTNWEYPKKSGIRIREILNRNAGEVYAGSYLVDVPTKITGKIRLRRQFKTREEAESWAKQSLEGSTKQGHDFFELNDTERRQVSATLPVLKQHGVSLDEAVRYAVKHIRPEGRTKSAQDVIAEIVTSKEQRFKRGDLRDRSFKDFKQRTEKFALGFHGKLISEISIAEIRSWLNELKLSSRSNQNYLSVIGEVFKYATQCKYIGSSPIDELTDTDRRELCGATNESKEPSILTPAQTERLLLAALAHPELQLLGAVTLALFCGLRTEELKRLDWESVKLSEDPASITIGAKIAKKRRIRHVEIPSNALEWLKLVNSKQGSVSKNLHYNDHQKRFKKLLKLAKFKTWESNAMRHSFGSYHYALYGNPLETARLLGHKSSDQVLFDHYRALATKAQAISYFAITPPANTNKIVRFA